MTVALVAAGTGRSATAASTPIKIGILSTCKGPFAAVLRGDGGRRTRRRTSSTGGRRWPEPSDGCQGPGRSAGTLSKSVQGCSDATPDMALAEARRLVEQVGVDILIGPLSGSEGIAVANYSKKQPNEDVPATARPAHRTRRSRSGRRTSSASTRTARSGWRASATTRTTRSGWRNVVTIGDDYDFPYTQTAGFVAEFCALGGKITKRIWPPLGTKDYSSYIAQIPTIASTASTSPSAAPARSRS